MATVANVAQAERWNGATGHRWVAQRERPDDLWVHAASSLVTAGVSG